MIPVRIYRLEESDDHEGCTSIEYVAGPKRYMRIWDTPTRALLVYSPNGLLVSSPNGIEWGWSLHPDNVLIYGPPTV